jgi:hypothetical protein
VSEYSIALGSGTSMVRTDLPASGLGEDHLDELGAEVAAEHGGLARARVGLCT